MLLGKWALKNEDRLFDNRVGPAQAYELQNYNSIKQAQFVLKDHY